MSILKLSEKPLGHEFSVPPVASNSVTNLPLLLFACGSSKKKTEIYRRPGLCECNLRSCLTATKVPERFPESPIWKAAIKGGALALLELSLLVLGVNTIKTRGRQVKYAFDV